MENLPIQYSWQAHILKEFIPQVNRLTLVSDPDYLVTEEDILQRLQERGFDILLFEDPVAFRFAYETKYRSKWDSGDSSIELVVVVHEEAANLRLLPYDIFQTERKLSFSLGDIFPNLSYAVIKSLDRSDLEPLYQAYCQYAPGKLGDNATKDFLLSRVFDLDAEFIGQPSDLLRVLLRRHYRDQHIPKILDQRFIQILHQYGKFEDWPLETIIQDREAFFSFLQERWPIFLKHITVDESLIVHESPPIYSLKYSGLPNIPFDHEDVRVYIDTLFLDGLLQPIAYPQANKPFQQWIMAGIRVDPEADRQRRLEGLIMSVETAIPKDEARYQDWFVFARRWTELIVLWHEIHVQKQSSLEQQFYSVQKKVDTTFQAWVMKRYSSLYNLPSTPPIMLHHIAHDIAQYMQTAAKEKVALIIMDGLAFDQWIVLREVLLQQRSDVKFRENMVFAWLPTITSVSRQSIFAGKPPLYYPESIFNTNKEAALWTQFWNDKDISHIEVAYKKGLGEGTGLSEIEELLSHPKMRVAGFIIDTVDKIVHGMELGTAGMHNQVRQWATQGFMTRLLDLLLKNHFDIFITSDHGNIEARGCGQISEGAIVDLRGVRARVYSDTILRAQVQKHFPDAIDWPPFGLPENFLPLLAPNRSAFISEGKRVVGHGGISIEEMIVPYIEVKRKTT